MIKRLSDRIYQRRLDKMGDSKEEAKREATITKGNAAAEKYLQILLRTQNNLELDSRRMVKNNLELQSMTKQPSDPTKNPAGATSN